MESLERTAHTLLRENRVEARSFAYTHPGGKMVGVVERSRFRE